MRRVLVTVFLALVMSSAVVTAAGASKVRFGTYGNLRFGDCSVTAVVNMEQTQWPDLQLTTKQALTIWHQTGSDAIAALRYVQFNGIAGHFASSVDIRVHPSKTGIIQALQNHQTVDGFFGPNQGFDGGHAMAIIGAGPKGFTAVLWGEPKFYRWSNLPNGMAVVTW